MVVYSVIHKRVFTPLRDLPTRIIEAIDHSSNSTIAFAFTKNPTRNIFFCKCQCWVWRMINSLYHSSRKVPGWCENCFVNYRINYQKPCDLMRQITKELNYNIRHRFERSANHFWPLHTTDSKIRHKWNTLTVCNLSFHVSDNGMRHPLSYFFNKEHWYAKWLITHFQ